AVALALCLVSADRWLPDSPAAATLVTAGAALAVLCPLLYASVARSLSTRPLQWLGSRSFSLYLVHFPIVLACAFGLDRPGLPLLAATAIPASLLAAELFHRAVERPCHRLAHAATAQIAARAPHRPLQPQPA
ncbi:MAG: acyltransferase, partial [Conexibacter sp.]|nr:acyltransferase [Conexibacter sp.]